jgi:hypothetical protein
MKKILSCLFLGAFMIVTGTSFAVTNYNEVCVKNSVAFCTMVVDYNFDGTSNIAKTIKIAAADHKTIDLSSSPSGNLWLVNAHCDSDNKTYGNLIVYPGNTIHCDGAGPANHTCTVENTWEC